mgnify:CR=1 FL=1
MAETPSSTRNRKKTPPTYDTPQDARQKGGKYPNYWTRKTRSGHTILLDDTNGNEHITIQHRSGTLLQFMPDGALHIVSHKGRYDVTFGEHSVTVTGAQDTTVNGDVSLKAWGDSNKTVYGNATTSVKGHSVETSTSKSTTVTEGHDSVVGWETKKVDNSSTEQVQGAKSIISHYGMTIASTGDSVAIGATDTLGMKSGGQTAIESGGLFSLVANGNVIALDGAKIYINSGVSNKASDVTTMKPVPEPSKEPVYTPPETTTT